MAFIQWFIYPWLEVSRSLVWVHLSMEELQLSMVKVCLTPMFKYNGEYQEGHLWYLSSIFFYEFTARPWIISGADDRHRGVNRKESSSTDSEKISETPYKRGNTDNEMTSQHSILKLKMYHYKLVIKQIPIRYETPKKSLLVEPRLINPVWHTNTIGIEKNFHAHSLFCPATDGGCDALHCNAGPSEYKCGARKWMRMDSNLFATVFLLCCKYATLGHTGLRQPFSVPQYAAISHLWRWRSIRSKRKFDIPP